MSDSSNPSLSPTGYSFGPFVLDLTTHELRRDDTVIPLTPKAYATLLVLLERGGRVVPKDELMKAVWPDSFVSDESLSQNIWGLRRALSDDTNHPTYIATLPRRGYRFIAPVTSLGAQVMSAGSAPAPQAVVEPVVEARRLPLLPLALAGVVMAALGSALTYVLTRPAPASAPVVRFHQAPPPQTTFASGGLLSPDGRFLAFLGHDAAGTVDLWVRPIESGTARRLPGTTGAGGAFWAPDGSALAFYADGKLKRVDVTGDAVQTLADVGPNFSGGSWHANGTILVGQSRDGIIAVPASGGTPRQVTTPDRSIKEWSHRSPQFLPDGRRFLFMVISVDPERTGTYVGALDAPGAVTDRLFDGTHVSVTYAATGHLLFVHDGDLMAQPFDATSLQLGGTAAVIATGASAQGTAGGSVSVSNNGFLAFGGGRSTRLTWFDRNGAVAGAVDAPAPLHQPVLLAGDRQLLATGSGVWLIDLERGVSNWIVPDGAAPAPSGDGQRIAFSAARRGVADVFIRAAEGTGNDEVLFESGETKAVQDLSRDGRYLVFSTVSPRTRSDLWLLPLEGERVPRPYMQTAADEMQARVSPDSRSMAYVSNETGRREVIVQSFPAPGAKRTVSASGGSQPVWRGDGRELYYIAADQTMMAVSVTPGQMPQFSAPQPLFRAPLQADDTTRAQFAVTSDGRRFLVDVVDREKQEPIHVLFNWAQLLPR